MERLSGPGGRHRPCDRRTQQPERSVALSPAYDAGDLVFAAVGRPLNPNNVLRAFAALARTANVPRMRFHDLWHAHTTWLLAASQQVQVVSERLGHGRISVTLDTYAHVLPDMQEGAAEADSRLSFSAPGL